MAKKKRGREAETETKDEGFCSNGETVKTKDKKKLKHKKRQEKEIPTVSIAVAGSIIHNAQSLELATRLAGQIARAATIFRVDEIVVFDNKDTATERSAAAAVEEADGDETGAPFLIRILKYLETPQYLRRSLFPMHNSLRCVGTLPPLDAPHHLRKHEWCPYREGVTLKDKTPDGRGTLVDVGLTKNVVIDETLESGIRVTVAMGNNRHLDMGNIHKVVPSSMPREDGGLYWGYNVRYAPNISSVFKGCSYRGGYDHTIGTSEHGLVIKSSELNLPTFRHLLIAFGGLAGLEESIEEDGNVKVKDAPQAFDSYLNTCPNQGSRTIRTEVSGVFSIIRDRFVFLDFQIICGWKEAIFISLQYFQEPISRAIQQLEGTS